MGMRMNLYLKIPILIILILLLGVIFYSLVNQNSDNSSNNTSSIEKNTDSIKSMMWAIIPMMLTLFMMEFYFSNHPNEELGWNTAFGNSLMIMFISFGLFGRLIEYEILGLNMPTVFTILLFSSGISLTIIDFLKLLPKDLAFGFSSSLTVNSFGILTILVVYTGMSLSLMNILYLISLLFTLLGITKMIHIFTQKEYVETKEEKIENMKFENLCLQYLKNGITFPEIRKKFRESGLSDAKISYIFGIIINQSYEQEKLTYRNYLFSRYPSSFR